MAKETYCTHMQDVKGVSGDRAYILILDVGLLRYKEAYYRI